MKKLLCLIIALLISNTTYAGNYCQEVCIMQSKIAAITMEIRQKGILMTDWISKCEENKNASINADEMIIIIEAFSVPIQPFKKHRQVIINEFANKKFIDCMHECVSERLKKRKGK